MNSRIELHDSKLANVSNVEGRVIVHLSPAYLHKSTGRPGVDPGTGWTQDANLIFENASVSGELPDLPVDVVDGHFVIGPEQYWNEILIPVVSLKEAELQLVLDSDRTLTVAGSSVKVELLGEPRYVEEFEP